MFFVSYFGFFFVLLFPFLNFSLLFLHSPFFYFKGFFLKRLFVLLSVFNLFLTTLFVFFVFFECKSINVVSELSFGVFYSSHVNSVSNFFNFYNLVVLFTTPFLVNFCLLFDSTTIVMLFVVIIVSSLVQLFSTEYMAFDFLLVRFFMFLNFFTLCMLILVTAGSFVQLFIGWEGVGLASFFLIGFWFSRVQAVKCALKAVIVNRVGDCALLFVFALLIFLFGDTSYSNLFFLLTADNCSVFELSLFTFFEQYLFNSSFGEFFYFDKLFLVFLQSVRFVDLVAVLICIGAFAKSAQFGLHTWLPDAMEGPTPVSALIHAATMVTAGVFLLIRSAPLIAFSCTSQFLLIFIGSLTALFGASTAFTQFDIKKIIAYSTCSQLGYMVVACGLLLFDFSLFHLATHAFFKAGLFMCAGLIIHALNNEQDIRKFGGLINILPLTYFAMFLCSVCLGGFPFFAGYFSKDAIIEFTFKFGLIFWLSFFLLLIAACFTVAYSIRLFFYVFWRSFTGFRLFLFNIHETVRSVIAVLLLSLISVFLGYVLLFGFYTNFISFTSLCGSFFFTLNFLGFYEFWIFSSTVFGFYYYYFSVFNLVYLFLPFMILFILFATLFVVWTFIFKQRYTINLLLASNFFFEIFFRHLFVFFSRAWFADTVFTKSIRVGFFYVKFFLFRFIESGVFEYFLSLWITRVAAVLTMLFNVLQDGRLSAFFSISASKVALVLLSIFLLVLNSCLVFLLS